MRLILNNSRVELIPLKDEILTMRHYIELQSIRFENKFDYSIIVDPDIDEDNLLFPPMLAQPFIENSIEHGFKGIDYKGFIRIEFKRNEDSMQLIIKDNGRGIAASLKGNASEKEHKSLATIISKNRMANLQKTKSGSFSIRIIDHTLEGEENGTSVVISMPLIRVH